MGYIILPNGVPSKSSEMQLLEITANIQQNPFYVGVRIAISTHSLSFSEVLSDLKRENIFT